MLCDECRNREATYHEVREINGYRSDRHLCDECRRKKGYKVETSFFDDFFNPFGVLGGLFEDTKRIGRVVCPSCGTTLDDFASDGLLGCENCYDEFAKYLLPRLKQMQAKITHEGKNPDKKSKKTNPEYIKLKKELAKAVEEEEYDKASEIQEKIKKMEKEGNV